VQYASRRKREEGRMADNPLARKLLIKPGNRLLVLSGPPDWLERLGPLPDGVQVADGPGGPADVVHLCVSRKAEVDAHAPAAMAAARPGGVLWASYPKRSAKVATDLTRDHGWEAFAQAGWRPVTQVSVDDVWSALRFRPLAEVGS
jgi:hypothetical protein